MKSSVHAAVDCVTESFEVGGQVSDLKHQVDYLDGAMRAVFEKLETDPPPRPVNLRSRATVMVGA